MSEEETLAMAECVVLVVCLPRCSEALCTQLVVMKDPLQGYNCVTRAWQECKHNKEFIKS